MDRFIESGYYFAIIEHNSLKSNMDRFIANKPSNDVSTIWRLKSNMDRFIAIAWFKCKILVCWFKIQYG